MDTGYKNMLLYFRICEKNLFLDQKYDTVVFADTNRTSFVPMFSPRSIIFIYSSVRVIASRILHEICLLIGELAIRGIKLTLDARLGTKSNLLIEQYCY